ncbi:MAG: DUF5801 repeats-in-toxin domain-containing protein [Hyphomicrobium sp.]
MKKSSKSKVFKIIGLNGNDNIKGTSANEQIYGLCGNDILNGAGGNDSIFGNQGNDLLIGGRGNDKLYGGSGTDTAIFSGECCDYQIIKLKGNGGWIIKHVKGNKVDGIDFVSKDVEKLIFKGELFDGKCDCDENNVPIAKNDAYTTNEDTPIAGGSLKGNDTPSADGGNIWTLIGGPANGTVVVNPDGTFTYTPNPNFNGTDTFTYKITDKDGDVSTAVATVTIVPVDDPIFITGLNVEGGEATVDEDDLPDGQSPDAAGLTKTGAFQVTAIDGLDDVTVHGVNVITNGVATIPGPIATQYGVLTITSVGISGTTGATISYSFTLNDNTTAHGPANNGENVISEALAVVLTDIDGDTANASIDINVVDDVPSVYVKQEVEFGSLYVDESNLSFDATANLGFLFGVVPGADNPATTGFALGLTGAATNLLDVATGQPVTVSIIAGQIVGVNTNGDTVFVISVDALGVVKLDQQRALTHPDATNPNDVVSLPFDLVTLTGTATDTDGDQASATLNIGGYFYFADAGPSITTAALNAPGAVTLDETAAIPGPLGEFAAPLTTTGAASIFTLVLDFGADGAGTVDYTLEVVGGGAIPIVTAYGDFPITLTGSGTTVVTGSYVDGVSKTAFTITINPDGSLTLSQYVALEHLIDGGPTGDPSHDDPLDLTGYLNAAVTVTDRDNDPVTQTIAIGASVVFKDGGPTAVDDDIAGQQTQDVAFAYNVLTNDLSGPDTPLVVSNAIVTQGLGTVTFTAAGLVTYTPAAGEAGIIKVQYTILDSDDDNDIGVLTFEIEADSVPQLISVGTGNLDEDGFPTANPDHGPLLVAEVDGNEALSNAIEVVVNFGADVPTTLATSYELLDTPTLDTQLQTLDGQPVTFTLVGGDLVGTVDAGATEVIRIAKTSAVAGPGLTDVTYTFTATLLLPIKHPLNTTEDTLSLLGIPFQVTDKDGDVLPGTFAVNILDDVPVVSLNFNANGGVTVDESDKTAAVATINIGANTAGDDPDVPGTGVIASDASLLPSALPTISFGADGPNAVTSQSWTLTIGDAVSGLFVTDGSAINLVTVSPTVVVGIVAAGALAGQAAFAVEINTATGALKVEQYLSIKHPDPLNTNESVNIDDFKIFATVTITDGDGDQSAAGYSIGDLITFHDDVSTAFNVTDTEITDDEGKGDFSALSNPGVAPGIAGADVAGTPATASGVAGALFTVGADGIKSIVIDNPAGVKAIWDDGTGIAKQETLTYATSVDGLGNTTLTATGADSLDDVFTLLVNADGSYTFTQLKALVHPVNTPANEDDLNVVFNFTVTDGDDDATSGSLTVTVDDDTPVVQLSGSTFAKLVVDESVGELAPGETEPVGTLGQNKIALANYLTDTGSAGADGPASITYSLNVPTSQPTLLTDTLSNAPITLVPSGATTIFGRAAGTDVFRIDIDAATGELTLTQYRPIKHPTTNPDESLSMALNALTVVKTVVDGDGDSVSASAAIGNLITFEDSGPTAGAPVLAGTTDEDALSGGNLAGPGDFTPATNGPLTLTGSLGTDYGSDGSGSIAFASGTTTINGITVTLTWDGVDTLTANDGEENVFTVVVNQATGGYTVTQLASLDHHTAANKDDVETDATFNLSYTITDGDGDTASGSLSFTIDDDTPTGGAVVEAATEVSTQTNLMLIVDNSGSLSAGEFATIKTALINLINQYDANGDVVVRIVSFNDNATTYGASWMNVATAIATINGLPAPDDSTNYDAAIAAAQAAFASPGKLTGPGIQNVSYFLTDGDPNPDSAGLDGGEEGLWESFLATNDIVSYGLGMTADATLGPIEPIAFNGALGPAGTEMGAVLITDLSQLSSVLVSSAAVTLETGTLPFSFGADGAAATGAIAWDTTQAAPAGFTYEYAGNDLIVKQGPVTVLTVTLNPANGNYTIKQNATVDHPLPGADVLAFSFAAKITDGDADGALSTITFSLTDAVPTAAIALNGNTTLTIDETAGDNSGSDDTLGSGNTPVPAAFAAIAGAPIEVATDATPLVVTTGSAFGADGPGTMAVTVAPATVGIDSGLDVVDGRSVYLYQLGALVVGRIETTLGSGPNAAGAIAFAVSIDSTTGAISLAQYAPIKHDDLGDPDEANDNGTSGNDATPNDTPDPVQQTLANGALVATVTVTDGDGDVATQSVAIGSRIVFEDDGGTLGAFTPGTIPNQVGTLMGFFSYVPGADGHGNFTVTATPVTGLTFTSSAIAGGTRLLAETSGGTDVFALNVRSNGTYTFELITPGAASTQVQTLGGIGAGPPQAFIEAGGGTIELEALAGGLLNVSTQGLGIQNNLINQAPESFRVEFHTVPGTLGTNTAANTEVDYRDSISFVANGAGSATWTARDTVNGFTQSGTATIAAGTLSIDPTISFNQIDITWASGSYRLDQLTTTKLVLPPDVTLAFQITATDGDGDPTATQTLNIHQVPANANGSFTLAGFSGTVNDVIAGSTQTDAISGGSGVDIADYSDSTSAISINLNDSGNASGAPGTFSNPSSGSIGGGDAAGDTLSSIEGLIGGSGNDFLFGNSSANVLYGQSGSDTLRGEDGADTLHGGLGQDSLRGDGGADIFVFTDVAQSPSLATADTIVDFSTGTAGEVIDLSLIDANAALVGDQSFAFLANGTPAVNPGVTANSVSWFQSGGDTIVQADTTGDTTADFVLRLTGTLTLTADDFIL